MPFRLLAPFKKRKPDPTDTIAKDSQFTTEEKKRNKVVVLVDAENLKKNSIDDPFMERLEVFLRELSKKADIITLEVLLPGPLMSKESSVVSNLHSADVIYCFSPRNFLTRNGAVKEKNTVDAKLNKRGKQIVDNYKRFEKLVIVSGDFDFNDLRKYAEYRGIEVKIVSIEAALSSDYLRAQAAVELI